MKQYRTLSGRLLFVIPVYIFVIFFLFTIFLSFDPVKGAISLPSFSVSFSRVVNSPLLIQITILLLSVLASYKLAQAVTLNGIATPLKRLNQLVSSFKESLLAQATHKQYNTKDKLLTDAEKNLFILGKLLSTKEPSEEMINLLVATKEKLEEYQRQAVQIPLKEKLSYTLWSECKNCLSAIKALRFNNYCSYENKI